MSVIGKLRTLLSDVHAVGESLLLSCPGTTGTVMRHRFVRARVRACQGFVHADTGLRLAGAEGISILGDVSFGRNANLFAEGGLITIGANTSFNVNNFLGATEGEIEIGKDCLFGPNVVFRAADHGLDVTSGVPIRAQPRVSGCIAIGDNVWVGANAVILRGAKIGSNSIVAAGAVVKDAFPDYSLIAGVPAVVKKTYGPAASMPDADHTVPR